MAMLPVVLVMALGAGRYALSPLEVLHALAGDGSPMAQAIVWHARLPRILAAALIGAGLSASGGACQAVFRNPLVAPDLLGVLSGAAFGAALSILLGAGVAGIQVGAFCGGLLAMGGALAVARQLGGRGLLGLVLGGLIVNALFTAAVSMLKYIADPQDQLPAIIYWLMGSLSQIGWGTLGWTAPLLIVATGALLLLCHTLDLLSLHDDEARSLGLSVTAWRLAIIGLATLAAALTVSIAGIIGWVALLMPHLARLLVGAPHARMMPLCVLLGAIGVVLADSCARILTPGEIPLGMITELFGAAAFIFVLRGGGWRREAE